MLSQIRTDRIVLAYKICREVGITRRKSENSAYFSKEEMNRILFYLTELKAKLSAR